MASLLSSDHSFKFELLRTLGTARFYGADVGELLNAAEAIVPGDMESYTNAFAKLAERIDAQAQAIDSKKHPVSAREAYYRAATYYRAADFYTHGNTADPRIQTFWANQIKAFDKANALLPLPGVRVSLPAQDGSFSTLATFYTAQGASAQSPHATVILGIGFDGGQEEMMHACGFAALDRGFNVITFEGPGQPLVLRQQNKGFIPEWEKVVTPVVDYLLTRPDVDPKRIAMMGYSMSGYYVLRAAAFEHRLAAIMSVDGVWNLHSAFVKFLPETARAAYTAGDTVGAEKIVSEALASPDTDTATRWALDQLKFSFRTSTVVEAMEIVKNMVMTPEWAKQIQCPVWIGLAENDIFFKGQPEVVKEMLGDRGTLVHMEAADSAAEHCHCGATSFSTAKVYDWLEEILDTV